MKRKKVIIVGAGIGGLATAVQLAKKGFAVTVFEKNNQVGGRCGRIVRGGHIFDTGPTMYLFPRIYADYFASIGEDVNNHLKLLRTDPTFRLNFADNTHITITSDLRSMRSQLESFMPGSYQSYLNYLDDAANHYRIAMECMIRKSLTHPLEYFNPKNLYLFIRHRVLTGHYGYAKRYFKHPHLLAAFTFQDSYLSLNPYRAPAICSLFTYSEHTEGSFLPQGGMYEVIMALAKIARRNGVKIVCNSPVKKIKTDNKHVTGIVLSDGSSEAADFVIVNSDMSYAYSHLLPEELFGQKYLYKKFSYSAIIFHWGVNKVYPQLKTHNLFFIEPYKQGFDHILDRAEPPKQTHFYVQAPARTDPSRAPEGCDTLTVMVPINRLYPRYPVDWGRFKEHMREFVLDRLKQTGLSDLRKQIKFEACFTPVDWNRRYNLTYGSIYGLHHDVSQLGYLRPKREHPKYTNLFFVGADTHPGSGLPTVLLSSQYTALRVLERMKN